MGPKRPPFKPDTVFHVFNHGNGDESIYRQEENYRYFLKRYAYYIHPIAKTYAFCLMPNHFHLMIRVRGRKELSAYFESTGKDLTGFKNLSGLVSKQFSNLLNSYTKSFNKKYGRKGRLFLSSLNRKLVNNRKYHTRLINYIHQNPVHHGFVKSPAEWPFSSYRLILSGNKTKLEREEVLGWFGGRKDFEKYHEQNRHIALDQFY